MQMDYDNKYLNEGENRVYHYSIDHLEPKIKEYFKLHESKPKARGRNRLRSATEQVEMMNKKSYGTTTRT